MMNWIRQRIAHRAIMRELDEMAREDARLLRCGLVRYTPKGDLQDELRMILEGLQVESVAKVQGLKASREIQVAKWEAGLIRAHAWRELRAPGRPSFPALFGVLP